MKELFTLLKLRDDLYNLLGEKEGLFFLKICRGNLHMTPFLYPVDTSRHHHDIQMEELIDKHKTLVCLLWDINRALLEVKLACGVL